MMLDFIRSMNNPVDRLTSAFVRKTIASSLMLWALSPLALVSVASASTFSASTLVEVDVLDGDLAFGERIRETEVGEIDALGDLVEQRGGRKQSRGRRIMRPRPPRRRRLPNNRVQPGGGLDVAIRSCTPDGEALTALVPAENPVFTMRDYPTFLFYLPDAPETVDYAEFILLSADEKTEVYSTQFSPVASGIVSVSIPAEVDKALVVGEAYHWYLNVHCQTTTGVPAVNGWVERVAEDGLENSVSESVLPDIWYDAIADTAQTLLAEQQSAQLQEDAQTVWAQLLTAAELGELVNVPIVGPAMGSMLEPVSVDDADL